jgi:hypothetical protein
MSNGFGPSYATSPMDDDTRMGGVASAEESKEHKGHPLDSEKNVKLLSKLRDWNEQEVQRQGANRYQMALDEDYYDSMQWTEEDAQALIDRGQAPLVYNEIKPTIDWIIGTERQTRIDHKILPRRKDPESTKDAEIKTMLLKYLSDVNRTPFARSEAFESAVKAGVGWIEIGVRGDPTEELLYTRCENWRNILYDSNSVELDYSDARYIFRSRWLDDDLAIAYFPERADIIREAVQDNTSLTTATEDDIWYMGARVTEPGHDYAAATTGKYRPYDGSVYSWSRRSRVKLTECWYKVPVMKRKFNGGDFDNMPFDANNPDHLEALKQFSLYDKLELEIRCAIYCEGGLLFDGKSPYRHGRLPFVPVWCYRRKRDNAPYGKIRDLRDPQDDLNKRQSKALWILSSNRVTADEGAVDDWDELREEVARPDSVIIKKAGKELKIERDVQLAEEHLKLMDRDVAHIRNTGGVNNENLGRQSNVTSGIALQERKESGTVTTTLVFDNLRFAIQLVGEIELSNIEQFYTEPKVVRVTGERGNPKFEEINQPDGKGGFLNDITKFQADYVVAEQDYRSSLRQAMFESLFDIVGRLAQMNPQVALNLLDLVVEMADLPNRDQLVQRIRQINGQRDPDAEMTPEEQQAQALQEQKQQAQEQLMLATMENQLAKLVAETGKLDAQAMSERITAIYSSLQAGQVIATIPGVAAVADVLIKDAGFKPPQQEQQAVEEAAMAQQEQMQMPAQGGELPTAATGVTRGIETIENDGVINQPPTPQGV